MWNSKIDNFVHVEANTKKCFRIGVKTKNDATCPSEMQVTKSYQIGYFSSLADIYKKYKSFESFLVNFRVANLVVLPDFFP